MVPLLEPATPRDGRNQSCDFQQSSIDSIHLRAASFLQAPCLQSVEALRLEDKCHEM